MNQLRRRSPWIWFVGGAALVLILILITALWPAPASDIGRVDLRSYWGASYLLSQSENFADTPTMTDTKIELTDCTRSCSDMAWNPPWLLALLIPLTWLPFTHASWFWMLVNLVLVILNTIMIWRLSQTQPRTLAKSWIGILLAVLLFLPTFRTLAVGQISTLMLTGLVFFVVWLQAYPFLAGAILAATTIKPHTVYITVPILLLDQLWNRRWRAIFGFFLPVVLLTLLVFALRPTFLLDYTTRVSNSPLLELPTPTISYILTLLIPWQPIRLVSLIALPLTMLWWFRHKLKQREFNLLNLVNITLLLSLLTTIYGWSFDLILLLLPLQQLVVWLVERRLPRPDTLILATLLFIGNLAAVYQITLSTYDAYFFWLTPFIAILYSWGWWRMTDPREQLFITGEKHE